VPGGEFDPRPLLAVLARHRVDFVLVGGLAGIAHGSSYATQDIDIVYARDGENLERLAAALAEIGATLRGAPPGLPFTADAETLRAGLNFTLTTSNGPLDVLGEPEGAPRYEDLRAHSTHELIGGVTVRVASLDDLIAMKEAAGRPKDLLMASEYRTIADELHVRRSADDDEQQT
jgi:hypothetical protein